MNQNIAKKITAKPIAIITILALIESLFLFQPVLAGELENEKDTMTRLKAATASSHTIVFALSAANTLAAGETVTVDFGEDNSKFVVAGAASVVGDFTFNDGTARSIVGVDGLCTGHAGVNDVAVGIDDATGIVTFTACGTFTASGAGAVVTINYGTAAGGTNRVTNPAAGNNITVFIAGTNGDTGAFSTSIITDDQVSVTATVDSMFTFVVSSATCALGTLSTATVASCNYNVTTTTNSEDGYVTTIIEDGNLRDGSSDINDVADGTITAGAEEYGIGLTGTNKGFADERSITGAAQTIATVGSGPVAADQVTVTHKASITASTVAGNYAHTVTLVSTGTF